MKGRKDGEPGRTPGTRPPVYIIVVAASDWVKEHEPAAGANLWDALHAGEGASQPPSAIDRQRDPASQQADLEAAD